MVLNNPESLELIDLIKPGPYIMEAEAGHKEERPI